MPNDTGMYTTVSDTATPKSQESQARHTAVQSTNAVKGTPTKAVAATSATATKAKGHRRRHTRRMRKNRRRGRRGTRRR